MNERLGLGSGWVIYNLNQGWQHRLKYNPNWEFDMTQTKTMAKTIFIILALIFASSANAKAEGRVNFSFSVNVNGQNQQQGIHHDVNQFFNQVFNHGNRNHSNRNQGHYHVGANGVKHWYEGTHSQHKKSFNKKKKYKQVAKLTSKKRLVRQLRKLGYRHVKNIQRKGRFYTARAISPRGHKVWVKVDRYSGRVKGQRVLAWNNRR